MIGGKVREGGSTERRSTEKPLSIVIFSQEDPFYVKRFFDAFLSKHARAEEIKAVVLSKPFGTQSKRQLALKMFRFYGAVNFARMGARYAYGTVMAKRPVRAATGVDPARTYSIKQLVLARGLPLIERNDLNSEDFISMVRSLGADLFISISSPIIFRKDLLAIPSLGSINIHNAPLPRYRGMLPTFWQLYNGESQIGITIHYMNDGIDTGDILAQRFLAVVPGEALAGLMVRCKQEAATLMAGTLDDFRKGKVQPRKMVGEGSYFSFPTREDVKEFRRRGGRIV